MDLKAIEERANKATPGPWAWFPQSGRPFELRVAGAPNSDEPIMWVNTDERLSFIRREDRDLLQHARQDIPALLAKVKELEAALEHEHINRGFMEDVSRKHGQDAGFWYDRWQACNKDLMQALTYGVHYGNCQWVGGPDDTCTCGLFALMNKYAMPTGDNPTESDKPSDTA